MTEIASLADLCVLQLSRLGLVDKLYSVVAEWIPQLNSHPKFCAGLNRVFTKIHCELADHDATVTEYRFLKGSTDDHKRGKIVWRCIHKPDCERPLNEHYMGKRKGCCLISHKAKKVCAE